MFQGINESDSSVDFCNVISVCNDVTLRDVESSENRYDLAFQNFPSEEMFRLFIDKDQQHKGADIFDVREPWL